MRKLAYGTLTVVLASLYPSAAAECQAAALQGTAPASAPAAGGHGRREDWQRVPDIFNALGAKPGARIADLGAGEGWLTLRLARQVAPGGRVFAADISERALVSLGQRLDSAKLDNVELLLSQDDNPGLPYGTLDGVVILNAYHEMQQRVPVLAGIKRSLKVGGVLVIVDNAPPDSLRTRQEQTSRHMLALALARDDLEAHGFEIVSTAPDFITRGAERDLHREWMVVARRGTK